MSGKPQTVTRTLTSSNVRFATSIAVLLAASCAIAEAAEKVAGSTAHDASKESKLYFESDIRPIFKAHCFHCHGEDGVFKSGLDLRLVKTIRASEAIDAKNPAASMLLEVCVTGEMPKDGKPLPAHDINLIRRWLLQGAPTKRPEPEKAPEFYITEAETAHWAFQPVKAVSVPSNGQTHPIDAFIAEKLVGKQLSFAPQADRTTLIRRATLDLHGLPPTPEEIAEFVKDTSPQAWEKAIDRLLASPAYGERWGRHWLDVVGYADSNGGPKDSVRENAWHYRDYVVRSLNEGKPWDRFITEQLAGDELAGITSAQAGKVVEDPKLWDLIAATGYLRMVPDSTGDDPANKEMAREDVLVNTIRIIGSSLVGLTLQCAQCHDHRFDPVSHVDYHRIRALIEPAYNPADWRKPKDREYAAYTPEERAANSAIESKAKTVDDERRALIDREYDKYLEERMEKAKVADEAIKEQLRKAWHLSKKDRAAEQQTLLEKHDCNFEKADHLRFLPGRDKPEAERVRLLEQAASIRATKLSRVLMAATENPKAIPTTRRFHRGNPKQPKEAVAPGELQIFSEAALIAGDDPVLPTSGRRLAYAKWLTSGKHPTLTRVLVNRFWMHHFGIGLVATPEDFGMRTARPLQGDLLDYLAQRFVAGGWRLKDFHKLVMTSRAYQQSARNPDAEKSDSENRYLARMPLRRLEAEAVRDAMLAVSGSLDRRVGGAPMIVARNPAGGVVLGKELSNASNNVVHTVMPLGVEANRRSLYVQLRRNRQLSVLQAFDMPDMSPNCNQRVCSTVAPQSLMMLNDTFVIEQSIATAKRVLKELSEQGHPANADPATALKWQVNRVWNLAYGSAPSENEMALAASMLVDEIQRQAAIPEKPDNPKEKTDGLGVSIRSADARTRALAAFCQVVFASNGFLYAP